MDTKAIAKYVRMSPMKINVVLKLIRGKSIKEAYSILLYTNRRAYRRYRKSFKISSFKCGK